MEKRERYIGILLYQKVAFKVALVFKSFGFFFSSLFLSKKKKKKEKKRKKSLHAFRSIVGRKNNNNNNNRQREREGEREVYLSLSVSLYLSLGFPLKPPTISTPLAPNSLQKMIPKS